ncbi:MAG TPA: nuclear transport factor 2 family protein [Chloroflexota bacterium]|jgi:hypothetical protein
MLVRLGCALLLALLVLDAGSWVAAAQVTDPPIIVEAFERARGQRNVDTALAYFADDAVVRLIERGTVSFNGKAEIRRYLQSVGIRTPPLVTSNRHVVGNMVTWNERDQGQLLTAIDLTVEAVVQDGKIKSLVYRVATPPALDTRPVEGPTRLPALFALAGVVVLGTLLLLAASLGPRRRAPGSTLHGKLMSSLGDWHPAQH